MNRLRLLLVPAALLVLAAAAAAQAGAAGSRTVAGNRTITVNGTGIVTTVPDQAQFAFGVSVTGSTAKAALTANARRMNSLIEAIKRLGIPASAIQTSQISLEPNTNDSGTKILNFTAANTVTVTTKAIAKAGSIVDAAVAAGANTVSGPSLGRSGQLALQQRALKAAVADARARALAIAQASHVRLGAVLTVSESSSSPPVPYAAADKAAAAPSTPVEPGSVQIEEDVTVTFAIS